MKEIYPICATAPDPERILLRKHGYLTDGAREARKFAQTVEIPDADKKRQIEEVRYGVVRRIKQAE